MSDPSQDVWREQARGSFADISILGLHGLERMQASIKGYWPPPPIHHLSGLRPVDATTGNCTFSMPATGWWNTPVGVFNAGVMLWLADGPLGGAIITALPPGVVPVTSDISMNFLRPVTIESERLVGHATLIHAGRSLGLSEVRVEDAFGRLLGHGTSRCFLTKLVDPPPDPPTEMELYEPPQQETLDPYLREPIGSTIDQSVWDRMSGLEISRALIAGDLPAPPLAHFLGVTQAEAEEGMATVVMPASGWVASPSTAVYGGAIAFLADVSLSIAVGNTAPPRTASSPLDLKVNFLRPVFPDGRDLVAKARVTHRGRTLAVASTEIFNADNKRVAVATASVLILPDRPWLPSSPVVAIEEAIDEDTDS